MDGNDRSGRAAGGDAIDHEPTARAFAAISTTGTTRGICVHSIPNISPPSIAAIWPATSSLSPMPAGSGRVRRSPTSAVSPASQTRSSSCAKRPADCATSQRTQTVTWRQLDEALTVLAANLRRTLVDGDGHRETSRRRSRSQAEILADIARALASERSDDTGADMLFWAEATRRAIESHRRDLEGSAETAASSAARLSALEERARATALAMEFGFLLDHDRKLLSIGYLVAEGTLDPSCYDLLASEARLASFMAIAKGDVPARHWFRLGRAVTPISHGAALISWSGSMFEYLMPSLVMRAPEGSLVEADEPADRAAPDRLRCRARGALGRFGIRVQRPRSRVHLSVFEFRRARPRAEARARRERRRCALCDRAREHGRSAALQRATSIGSPQPVRAAATASTRLWTTRRAACRKARAWLSCEPSWRTIRE